MTNLASKSHPVVLLALCSIVLFAGCVREKPVPPTIPGGPVPGGAVRLRLVPTWEGEPFQPFVQHHNNSGYRVQVEKVQFYLGDLRLMNEGAATNLATVRMVNFSNGPVEFVLPVAAGTWSELAMGLGVPEEPNHSDPALYANTHPLSVSNGMHWNWTSGYVFLKFEGRYDLDPNSTGTFPSVFSLHTGFDEVYTEMAFEPALPITVTTNDTTLITLQVAIDRFFHSPEAGVIDLATENQSHGMNVPLSVKLTTNAINSFSLE